MNYEMQTNVGGIDRIARLSFGVLLVAVGVAGYFDFLGLAILGLSAIVVEVGAVLVGLYLAATGAARRSPVYAALGTSTHRTDDESIESTDDAMVEERPKAN